MKDDPRRSEVQDEPDRTISRRSVIASRAARVDVMADLTMDKVADIDPDEERPNQRLVRIVEQLSRALDQSVPKATKSRVEMEVVYRFVRS